MFPDFETAAIRTAASCLRGLGLAVVLILGRGELLPGLAACLRGTAS